MTAQRAVRHPGYETWSPPEDPGEAAAVTPEQIIWFVRSRGWIVALVTGICLLGGILFQLTSTPRYVATSQIIVDPHAVQNVSNDVAPTAENADAAVATVENEMRVLKSNTLLGALIDKENLTHDPEFARRPFGLVHSLLGLIGTTPRDAAATPDPKVAILQELDRAIAVRRTERSFVIDISLTADDPDKSARLLNTLVDLYIAQAGATRADLARKVGSALQDRLSELQARVRAADDKVEQFRADNNLVAANGVLTSDQTLRDMNSQLVLAQTQEDQERAKLEQIQRLRASNDVAAAPEALSSQAIIQLRSQIAEARRKLGALGQQLGPRHPDYVSANQELQTLQRLMSEELARVAQAARNQYGRSKDNEKALTRNVDALSRSALTNSKALVRLRELERDAEASRALFTAFLSRSRELNEETQLYTTNVRQISVALPPLSKANLPNSVVLLLSLIVGLMLGTALAVLLGLKDLFQRPARRGPTTWQRA